MLEALKALAVLEGVEGTEAAGEGSDALVAAGDAVTIGEAAGGWLADVAIEAWWPVLPGAQAVASTVGVITRPASRRRMRAIFADRPARAPHSARQWPAAVAVPPPV